MKISPIIYAVALCLATSVLFTGTGACDGEKSMAIFAACEKACTGQPMFELCMETLRAAPDHSDLSAYGAVAARAALESCAATERAGNELTKDPELPEELRAAYNNCVDKYGYARRDVAAVGDALSSCALASLKRDCDGAVAAVDECARKLRPVGASSPLYRMDLADRDRITLACSLGSLVSV